MKKALLGLFLGLICSISFGNCVNYSIVGDSQVFQATNGRTYTVLTGQVMCFTNQWSTCQFSYSVNGGSTQTYSPGATSTSSSSSHNYLCVQGYAIVVISRYDNTQCNFRPFTFNLNLPSSDCPSCPSCPTCPDTPSCPKLPTTLNVFGVNLSLSGYDFVTLHGDSISYNGSSTSELGGQSTYIVSLNNDYSGNICTGDSIGTGINWSALFINGIEHQSAPLINVTIPEEYSWDSTVDESEFNLVISGSNVDYEYIDNIITTQKTLPNSQDFNNIVSGLIPLFVPGLCIILLIYFIYLFIKKVF